MVRSISENRTYHMSNQIERLKLGLQVTVSATQTAEHAKFSVTELPTMLHFDESQCFVTTGSSADHYPGGLFGKPVTQCIKHLIFYPPEVVCRFCDPQLQVGENHYA